MKALLFLLVGLTLSVGARAMDAAAIERQVAEAIKQDTVTVVHFWAPWCSNCNAELGKNGWADFIAANPKVQFIFVTIWHREDDGKELLAKHGLGAQPNLRVLHHPNPATREDTRLNSFLGQRVTWVPASWVYRKGNLLYAMNYGELRFPLFQQLLKDAARNWD